MASHFLVFLDKLKLSTDLGRALSSIGNSGCFSVRSLHDKLFYRDWELITILMACNREVVMESINTRVKLRRILVIERMHVHYVGKTKKLVPTFCCIVISPNLSGDF